MSTKYATPSKQERRLRGPRKAEHRVTKRIAPRRSARLVEHLNTLPSPRGTPSEKPTLSPLAESNHRKRRREPEDDSGRDQKVPRHSLKHESLDRASLTANDRIAYWTRTKDLGYRDMNPPLSRRKSGSSLRRGQSDSGSGAREEPSAPYRDQRYETLLAKKGSFLDEHDHGINEESRDLCRTLLEREQALPQDSLFHGDKFERTCRRVRSRKEKRVYRDITPLIVPPAEILAICGDDNLENVADLVDETWFSSKPFVGPSPKPDYSAGFRREAFPDTLLHKLDSLVGDLIGGELSFYAATYLVFFPFLACEAKCSAVPLEEADRQNAHSMTLAVRGVVELFKRSHREKEVDRLITAFSVSHDHQTVRIYGHYAVIDVVKTTYFRHLVRSFSFTELDGKERWAAYKFVRNLYDVWVPAHLNRLCSAIQSLPDSNDLPSEGTSLSQALESQQISIPDSQEEDGEVSLSGSQYGTSKTSYSQPSKKVRREL